MKPLLILAMIFNFGLSAHAGAWSDLADAIFHFARPQKKVFSLVDNELTTAFKAETDALISDMSKGSENILELDQKFFYVIKNDKMASHLDSKVLLYLYKTESHKSRIQIFVGCNKLIKEDA